MKLPDSGNLGLKPGPDQGHQSQPAYPIPSRPVLDETSADQTSGGQPGPYSVPLVGVGTQPDGSDKQAGPGTARRASMAKIGVALAFGLLFAALSLVVNNPPADGPTATLADEVLDDPLFVIRSPASPTPTMMSSEAIEAPPTTLNPNAIFVSALAGSDDNNGADMSAPIQSLQSALGRLQPGETLYVMDGQYRELTEPGNTHYVLRNSGTPEAWVRVENAPGHNPEIIANDGNGLEVQANYVEVIGLRVRGEGFDPEGNPWGNGMLIRNSHHVNLVGNEISDMPSNGISAVESSNLGVINNDVHDNAFWNTAQNSGISFWHSRDQGQPPDADGYHDRIIGNRLYRNENKVMSMWHNYELVSDGNGIIIDEGLDTGYNNRILVLNNEIFDNGGRAVLVYQSANVDVFFNTTYRNAHTPELLGGPTELAASESRNIRFFNNLVWPLDDGLALRTRENNNVETAGNLIISTANDLGAIGSDDTVIGRSAGLVNPTIDENVANFRVTSDSTAIGAAALISPNVKFDRDGNDRSQQPPTVGAYILTKAG